MQLLPGGCDGLVGCLLGGMGRIARGLDGFLQGIAYSLRRRSSVFLSGVRGAAQGLVGLLRSIARSLRSLMGSRLGFACEFLAFVGRLGGRVRGLARGALRGFVGFVSVAPDSFGGDLGRIAGGLPSPARSRFETRRRAARGLLRLVRSPPRRSGRAQRAARAGRLRFSRGYVRRAGNRACGERNDDENAFQIDACSPSARLYEKRVTACRRVRVEQLDAAQAALPVGAVIGRASSLLS